MLHWKTVPGVGPGLVSIPALISNMWTKHAGMAWSLIKKMVEMAKMVKRHGSSFLEWLELVGDFAPRVGSCSVGCTA